MAQQQSEFDPLAIHTLSFKAMGSPCEVHLQGDATFISPILQAAKTEALRLEKKYSRYLADSVTSQINQNAFNKPVLVDAETAGLLNYAQMCFEISDGLFDITSGILRRAWDFKSSALPNSSDIEHCLMSVGWQHVRWDGEAIHFRQPNMEIDFGGVVKEFAADRIAQHCRELGAHAGLVELGGDISIVGPKKTQSSTNGPQLNSETNASEYAGYEPWLIGIRHPQTGAAMASIPLWEGGVATSGSYERFMMVDGQQYCHILNPKTGWPVQHLASVSVIAPQCLVAGSLSTIAMLKGELADVWLQEQEAQYLLLTDGGDVLGTIAD